MTHLDLFSGIGGFALAAERVWPKIEHTFCEIDPFCVAVLKKHWPKAKIYGDIKIAKFQEKPFILTASPPCQAASSAGKKRGTEDARWLWPETIRVIEATKPEWVILENVRGLLTLRNGVEFEDICSRVEGAGYEIQPLVIGASAVGAPHRRDRVWILGNAKHHGHNGSQNRQGRSSRGDRDAEGEDEVREPARPSVAWNQAAARFSRMDDGLSLRMERIKSLGNAIVPAVAEQIFRAIKTLEDTK